MNENINLCEILKDCPINTGFYSPMIGNCKLSSVNSFEVVVANPKGFLHINPDATATLNGYKTVELMLFPSQTLRDWNKWKCPKSKKSKFDPKTLQPFDKVLVKSTSIYNSGLVWRAELFSYLYEDITDNSIRIYTVHSNDNCISDYVIPYNEDTKHLVNTEEEAPEYYRYWED